jgi:hypothetical protein
MAARPGGGRSTEVGVAQPAEIVEPLEPATLTDMLDGGWKLLRERPGTVLGLSAVCLAPAAVLEGLAAASVDTGFSTLFTFQTDTSDTGLQIAGLLATLVGAAIRALGVMYLGVALTLVVLARQSGARLGAAAALGAALRRSGAVLGSWALMFPVSAVASSCFLPLPVWATFTAVAAPVIAAEGIGPIASIGRSFQLVARRFWMALGVVALSTLVVYVLDNVLTLLPQALAEALPWGARWAVNTVAAAVASTITTGPLVTSCVLLYLDLRVRTEGLDLRQRAAAAFTRAG